MAKFLKLIKNDKGATAIEYGLIAALIAVAAIAAMGNIGNQLGKTFNNVSTKLQAAASQGVHRASKLGVAATYVAWLARSGVGVAGSTGLPAGFRTSTHS
jgi:pilus assembly protein Flp/PilA